MCTKCQNNLVSFGKRMSTRIFASYLRVRVRSCPFHALWLCRCMMHTQFSTTEMRAALNFLSCLPLPQGVPATQCECFHSCFPLTGCACNALRCFLSPCRVFLQQKTIPSLLLSNHRAFLQCYALPSAASPRRVCLQHNTMPSRSAC